MWPAKCQLSGLEVAVRSFTKGQLTQAQQDTLEAAIRQQATVSHPSLLQLEGAVRLAGLGLASLSNTASSPAVASKEADCWAIGALAYHACVGKSAEANLSQVPAFPLWLSDHGKAFIASAMDPDPKQRATVDALLATAWIRNHTKAGADHIQGSITPSAAPIKLNVPASEPEPVSAPALPLVSALEPEPVPELKTRRSIPLAVTIPAVEEDIRKRKGGPVAPEEYLKSRYWYPSSCDRIGGSGKG
ncbi:hypothetical protein WJX72_004268 [[Myrmecia] bisecta]|uniref:Protein kinase domain-containing protein n=1 Tax=[Myrmecia] bisecta TaxID=41462 RepID=A0AAW1QEX4_9CHLO